MSEAAAELAGDVDAWYVYSGFIRSDMGKLVATALSPDWAALRKTNRPIVLVFRATDALTPEIGKSNASAVSLARKLKDEAAAGARRAGCSIAGIQWDYDCPSSSLGKYACFLSAQRDPGTTISFTALPAWLGRSEFRELAKAADWYVLQVHGIEPPADAHQSAAICEYEKVPGLVTKANRVGVPFRVALSTYAYRMDFDASGKYIGVFAEGDNDKPIPVGGTSRVVASNVERTHELLQQLKRSGNNNLRGIAYFRLPISSDRLNWTSSTLASLINGGVPARQISTEVRLPQAGLAEVWLRNTGEQRVLGEITMTARIDGSVIAKDTANGFRETDSGSLVGRAPDVGFETLAAWYRIDSSTKQVTTDSIHLSTVSFQP